MDISIVGVLCVYRAAPSNNAFLPVFGMYHATVIGTVLNSFSA